MTIASGQQALAADILKARTASGHLKLAASTELTIASGAVTANANFYRVDTESDAASDDLDTITAGSEVADGFLLFLRAENAARTVVIKHNTGNILCVGNNDISLDDVHDWALLIYDGNLTKWSAAAFPATRTRTLFVEFTWLQHDTLEPDAHPQGLIVSSNNSEIVGICYLRVPSDYSSGMTATPVIGGGTDAVGGNFYLSSNAYISASGETYNTHTDSAGPTAVANSADTTQAISALELDLSAAAAGDYITLTLTRDGANGSDTSLDYVYMRGFLVSYTADS